MKLDKPTTKEWEQKKKTDDLPTLDDMKEFLRKKADLLENLELTKGQRIQSEVKAYNQKLKSYVTSEIKCPICNENHLFYMFCVFGLW